MSHLRANQPSAFSMFGYSMGSDADLLIVGAYGRNDGEAMVYRRVAVGTYDLWTPWLLPGPPTFDYAKDVDITEDSAGPFAIVSDHRRLAADGTQDWRGAADIYRYDSGAGTWTLDASLTGAATGDRFGVSVAISGRYAAIGATGVVGPGGEQGCVYVYRRGPGGSWTQHAQLFADNTTDTTGGSVDIDDRRVVAGAVNSDAGAAYVFRRQLVFPGTWTLEQRLRGLFTDAGDWFGDSVAIDNENEIVIVGAHNRDLVAGVETGSAFVFERRVLTGSYPRGFPADTSRGGPLIHGPIPPDLRDRTLPIAGEHSGSGPAAMTLSCAAGAPAGRLLLRDRLGLSRRAASTHPREIRS